MPLVDYKNHKEGMPYELKFPFRPANSNGKWPRTSSSPQTRAAGTAGTLIKAPPADLSERNSAAIPRSVSSDGRPLNPKRSRDDHCCCYITERQTESPSGWLQHMSLMSSICILADIPLGMTTTLWPVPL